LNARPDKTQQLHCLVLYLSAPLLVNKHSTHSSTASVSDCVCACLVVLSYINHHGSVVIQSTRT